MRRSRVKQSGRHEEKAIKLFQMSNVELENNPAVSRPGYYNTGIEDLPVRYGAEHGVRAHERFSGRQTSKVPFAPAALAVLHFCRTFQYL